MTKIASGLSTEEARIAERAAIRTHNTRAPHGYNLTDGGEGSAHLNPAHGKNIAAAWKRPETRKKHMQWRTNDRLSAQANNQDTWMQQQQAWMAKRLQVALTLDPLEGSQLIWYRAAKSKEQAKRKGREQFQLDWMDSVRDSQILECWTKAGVPAPPASSWMVKTTAYEKRKRGRALGSNAAVTRSPPSCASTGGGERVLLCPSDYEDE